MAAPQKSSLEESLKQLNDARKMVLADSSYWPSVVQGVVDIVNNNGSPELTRWGSDFLAEAFSTPAMALNQKETLCLTVLETLKNLLMDPKQDTFVLRSAILAAASIYPLAYRWIINNSYDSPTWERITAIKTRILQMWDGVAPAVQVCCVKFVQRVVLVQTSSGDISQKRDGLDISLNILPLTHSLLEPRNLEAEAVGLLDRMLGVLQEANSNVLVVDATLNTLSVLIRTRPVTSGRIVTVLLTFNPLKTATLPLTSRSRVILRSMEKTVRMLLIHLIKRDPHNPQNVRLQAHVERLSRARTDLFDDTGRKRALEQQAGAYSDGKRQKLEAAVVQQFPPIPPLPAGPYSLADIFSLTSNTGLRNYSASQIPLELAVKISITTLTRVNPQVLDRALNGIRDRMAALEAAAATAMNPETAPLGVEEDEDDYEPDYYAAEDTEQILNKLESDAPKPDDVGKAENAAAALALGVFKLPPAPSLNPDLASKVGISIIARVLGMMQSLEDPSSKKIKAGLNRLAASSYDRDSWITILTRLATRTSSPSIDETTSPESENAMVSASAPGQGILQNAIREGLYAYILEDFRKRIDVAVSWLYEEWYTDRVAALYSSDAVIHYDKWALKLIDGFMPYLHVGDMVLTRFLAEIPDLSSAILARVKNLCRDPSMVQLALTSLRYLVMMRPPVRTLALDTVQDIWVEFEDARPMSNKYLVKWRPGFIEAHSVGRGASEGSAEKKVALAA